MGTHCLINGGFLLSIVSYNVISKLDTDDYNSWIKKSS